MEKTLISGVKSSTDIARVSVIGVKNEPGIAYQLFDIIAKKGINIDLIVQSVGRQNTKDISFVLSQKLANAAVEAIKADFEPDYERVEIDNDVAKVSIVGAGMMSDIGTAAKMFGAIYDVGVNIETIFTSEIKITVLVKEKYAAKVVESIREKLVD